MSLQLLTLIFIVVFFTTEAASGEEVKKAVGDQVYFKLDKIGSPVTSLTWKHITSGSTVKAIEWEEGEEITTPNPRFQDITTLNIVTGQINITNLTIEHSGLYTIDVSGKEQEQRFTLTVIERVPKPVIKIEKRANNSGVVDLICEYNETIIWKNSAGEILMGSAHTPKGESINVTKTGNQNISYYTCSVLNVVSEATSDPVYERDLFKVPDPKPDPLKESNKGCAVSAVIPSVTMVMIITLFLS